MLQEQEEDWYHIRDVDTIDSPALVVYRERMQDNILRLIQMAKHPENLRPHVKTNKMQEVCTAMLRAGIRQFKCATIAEAEMLAMTGAEDVLLAYQPVGPKIYRLIELINQYPATRFSCLTDNPEAAKSLSRVLLEAAVELSVWIDLNVGMNRTGIMPGDAVQLYRVISHLPNIRVIGIHAYDGHLRDQDPKKRKLKADKVFKIVSEIRQTLENEFSVPLKIVLGGSPTFPMHAQRDEVQCSPGTFVFWDWGYQHSFPDQPFGYAALLITRVISMIDPHTLCLDLGHKSVAAENPLPRVHFLNAPELEPVSQSEEHLVVRVSGDRVFSIGEVLYGVPVHICPTVALYERAVIIEENKTAGEWKVLARDRKISV